MIQNIFYNYYIFAKRFIEMKILEIKIFDWKNDDLR